MTGDWVYDSASNGFVAGSIRRQRVSVSARPDDRGHMPGATRATGFVVRNPRYARSVRPACRCDREKKIFRGAHHYSTICIGVRCGNAVYKIIREMRFPKNKDVVVKKIPWWEKKPVSTYATIIRLFACFQCYGQNLTRNLINCRAAGEYG